MKPELMAPVGDWTSLRAAVQSGADAVYCGVKMLNMRAKAPNFDLQELHKVCAYCHEHGVKVYLTVNTIIYEDELGKLASVLSKARRACVDAIICWDMAAVTMAREEGLSVFLSTQASVSNSRALQFYAGQGISRVVLARECTLEQIATLAEKTSLEIEVFVHGAMCVSISGRCFLSQYLFNCSANRGECLQPCRREYLIQDAEEGHQLTIGRDYVLSPRDLCTLPFLDRLIETGVSSLKIEGRGRSPEYVKTVTAVYREAIDEYCESRLTQTRKEELMQELKKVFNKGFSNGFFMGRPVDQWARAYGSLATQRKCYIGYVRNFYQNISVAEIHLKAESLSLGQRVMFQGKNTGVFEQEVFSMELNHEQVRHAKKGQFVALRTNQYVRPNDKVFVIEDTTS